MPGWWTRDGPSDLRGVRNNDGPSDLRGVSNNIAGCVKQQICRDDRVRRVLSVAWTCRDDKGLNGLFLSQNDLHLILRGFTHGGDPYDHFFLAVLVKNCHRNGHF